MPRKKQLELNATETDAATAAPADTIEAGTAAPEQKEWSKRPDPFGFQSINWQDGYKIGLLESDTNREIFIRFGSGQKSDQPQAFEAIKTMLREEHGMYWDPKVQGWAKGLKFGQTPLIREQNRAVRTDVEEAFYKAVALEEAARGPSLSEYAKERSAIAR